MPSQSPPDQPPSKITCKSPRPGRRTSATAFTADPPDADDPLLAFAPYLHKAPRRNSITPERQRAFIAMLAATGIVTQAARHVGVSLEALYALRGRVGAEGFAAAWELAIDRGVARLEDCALERAIMGEERPIVSFGKVLGTWRKYDTGLLTFLLRQRRSSRFGSDAVSRASLKPGNPLYEALKREWIAEAEGDEQAVLESIDAMIDGMRARSGANAALLIEDQEAGGES